MSQTVTETNYENFISNELSLIDIYANWCQPCKLISPIIDQISDERPTINIGKLDAESNREIISKLEIRSIPTILIFKKGKLVDKHIGNATKEQLDNLINRNLKSI